MCSTTVRSLGVLAAVAILTAIVLPMEAPAEFTSPSPLHGYLIYLPMVYSPPSYVEPVHGAGMSCIDRHAQLGIFCSEDCAHVEALELEWTHGWQLNPTTCPGVEAVPQISANHEIGQPLGGSSQWIVYLNEPESSHQSDTSWEMAAEGLRQVLEAYPDKKVLLPSASTYYLDLMWEAYGDPAPPSERLGISHHCYGWGTAAMGIDMCSYLLEDAATWGLEHNIDTIWVTEFGMDPYWYDGMEGTKAFMEGMYQVYRAHPMVERIAWFQVNPTAYVWSAGELGLWTDGSPTELGELYVELGGQYHAYP